MDRFDLEDAGVRVEVAWARGPRMARGQGEPLPLWRPAACPKVRRPANESKLMRANLSGAIPATPVAAHRMRGDPSFARAVAKAMPTGPGARRRPGVEIGRRKRHGQPKDLTASLAGGASFDASKATREWG